MKSSNALSHFVSVDTKISFSRAKISSLISSHAKLITCPIELKPLRGNDRHV
ncbi:hypothetical protein VL20_562 [Microcystis panniformis FACHB-1757]|uniref:Uncharacterized protein n=1 Tax=Microcystis panniformis FACHB-1757 TaxID=1638788 RepID=A0A0K1RVF0_9CHRO|nr:hypothetical protein VL20_562 [Microcystis panniformis FACHB-1757]